jgi:predicted nucleotidyltransferase
VELTVEVEEDQDQVQHLVVEEVEELSELYGEQVDLSHLQTLETMPTLPRIIQRPIRQLSPVK